jgi:hypothetical protein
MQPRERQFEIVTAYGVESYACGLRAGDRVELKKPLHVCDHTGKATGVAHAPGEVWTVLSGSEDDPGVVWFRQADGHRHTWDDDAAQIDEWFKRLGPPPPAASPAAPPG